MPISSYSWNVIYQRLVMFKCILVLLIMSSSTLLAQTIVVLGDTPYSTKEKEMLQGPNGILYDLINKTNPTVVMHLGDFKGGGVSCTDAVLKEHKALLNQISFGKLIYTPGDNDWTDCDRTSLLYSFDELERLRFLIKLMYQTSPLLDEKLASISAQSTQIENKLWINDRLAISTLHIVGTSNGRANIKKSNQQKAIAKVDLRDTMNVNWLKEIETKAKDFDALIIGFQADIYQQDVLESGLCDEVTLKKCDAFLAYRNAFVALAKRINKPVLVAHGDTSEFCFEKLTENLWHLNAAGDYQYLDATKVTFNKASIEQPFTVNGLINTNLPQLGCSN